MSLVLSNNLEEQVRDEVFNGLQTSSEDVLRAAFRLLDQPNEGNNLTDESWKSDGSGEGFHDDGSHVSLSP